MSFLPIFVVLFSAYLSCGNFPIGKMAVYKFEFIHILQFGQSGKRMAGKEQNWLGQGKMCGIAHFLVVVERHTQKMDGGEGKCLIDGCCLFDCEKKRKKRHCIGIGTVIRERRRRTQKWKKRHVFTGYVYEMCEPEKRELFSIL